MRSSSNLALAIVIPLPPSTSPRYNLGHLEKVECISSSHGNDHERGGQRQRINSPAFFPFEIASLLALRVPIRNEYVVLTEPKAPVWFQGEANLVFPISSHVAGPIWVRL